MFLVVALLAIGIASAQGMGGKWGVEEGLRVNETTTTTLPNFTEEEREISAPAQNLTENETGGRVFVPPFERIKKLVGRAREIAEEAISNCEKKLVEHGFSESEAEEICKGANFARCVVRLATKLNNTERARRICRFAMVTIELEEMKEKLDKCVERLTERGFESEVARRACKFMVGVKKVVEDERDKVARCVARLSLAFPQARAGELLKRCMVEALEREARAIRLARRAVRRVRALPLALPAIERRLEILATCANLPEEELEKLKELWERYQELRSEHREEVRSVATTCAEEARKGNLTEEEIMSLRESCGLRLKEINEKYRKEFQEIRNEVIEILGNRSWEEIVDKACVNELLEAKRVINETEEELESAVGQANMTAEEKKEEMRTAIKSLVEKLARKARAARKAKAQAILASGIREFIRREDVKSFVIETLKRNKELIREVLKDKEIKREIVNTLLENPRDVELLKEAIRDREARISLIRKAKERLELKRQILKREVLREFLPARLRMKIDRINVTDIETEQVGNKTAIKARLFERGRLLFFIPVRVPKVVKFIGEEIIAEQKPWWAFLVVG